MISEEELAQQSRHEPEMRYVDAIPTHDDPDMSPPSDHTPIRSSKFNVANAEAIPVFERGTTSFTGTSMAIGANAQMLLGRHKGRKYVVLSAPVTITTLAGATTPTGFQWSHDRGMIDANAGFQLNPGDSAQIDSEAEVWVGPLPGNTTGYVQYLELFNVLGGPSDS